MFVYAQAILDNEEELCPTHTDQRRRRPLSVCGQFKKKKKKKDRYTGPSHAWEIKKKVNWKEVATFIL